MLCHCIWSRQVSGGSHNECLYGIIYGHPYGYVARKGPTAII